MAVHAPVTLRLQASSDAPSRARRSLRDASRHLPGELVYDAELLTSEVVTNAVQHSRGIITVAIDCDRHSLAVAVTDSSPVQPVVVKNADTSSIDGRGLRLVDEMATAWGCQPSKDGSGKTVWFRMSV